MKKIEPIKLQANPPIRLQVHIDKVSKNEMNQKKELVCIYLPTTKSP